MKDFRQLKVWQIAHQFVLDVYSSTNRFPREELYGLTSQARRSALSIPSNIAEGCGREGDVELARFLQIAMGSASEVEYQLLIAKDLRWLEEQNYQRLNNQVCEIKRMLSAFLKRLRSKDTPAARKADC